MSEASVETMFGNVQVIVTAPGPAGPAGETGAPGTPATMARGQASYLGPTAQITFTEVDAYVSTGLTATFDAATAFGMTLGTVDAFGLKNTSGSTKLLRFFANVDIAGANFKQFSIRLALNGVSIAETECRGFSTGNEYLNLATSWMIELNDGDEVSLIIANNSSTDLIDLQRGRIVASEVFA